MKQFNENEQQQLKSFFTSCNDMIDGRFILSDIKIARILKAIAESQIIYELVTKCLINFSFEQELKNAKTSNRVNGGYFKMPLQEHKIIALVFCLLLEIDNKKLNLQNFITDNFFSSQGYNVSYSNFAMVMLIPFKNSVMNELSCKEDGTQVVNENDILENNQVKMEQVLENTKEITMDTKAKLQFANLRVALTELVGAIKLSSKLKINQKEELLIVSNAIADAIKHENLKLISALVIAFEYALKNNKNIKPYYNKFLQTFVELL